jgi:hypothetical protein
MPDQEREQTQVENEKPIIGAKGRESTPGEIHEYDPELYEYLFGR